MGGFLWVIVDSAIVSVSEKLDAVRMHVVSRPHGIINPFGSVAMLYKREHYGINLLVILQPLLPSPHQCIFEIPSPSSR